jgi:hypothetical protein
MSSSLAFSKSPVKEMHWMAINTDSIVSKRRLPVSETSWQDDGKCLAIRIMVYDPIVAKKFSRLGRSNLRPLVDQTFPLDHPQFGATCVLQCS